VPTLYQPLAQWDLPNGIAGTVPVLDGKAIYSLGDDTGLAFAYIDRDVTNGKTYYYALVAYDRGFVPQPGASDPNAAAIDPQENTFNVSVDAGGVIRGHSVNVAIATPRSRAAGYVEPGTNEDLSAPHGSLHHGQARGTGAIAVTVLDEALVPDGALFRLTFHDTLATGGTSYQTTAYTLVNRTNGEVLLARQAMAAATPAVAGLVIDFANDALALDLLRSGWRGVDGTGQPAVSVDPQAVGLSTTWRARVEVDPSPQAQVSASAYRLQWVDPQDSLYVTPRFSSAYPIVEIPVYCWNTTLDQACDLLVDDVNGNGSFDGSDALIVAEKGCRFCVHAFRFRVTFAPGSSSVLPSPGSVLEIAQRRPFAEGDYFEFTLAPAHVSESLAQSELSRVAVVPNPYVGAASWEVQTQITGRGPRRVQFIHLPQACVIRIFTVRGELVRELDHAGEGGEGVAWWDLRTEEGQEVSYGVYLYHVEAPGVGETTGKFAIIK
jgi:hypothetical protein